MKTKATVLIFVLLVSGAANVSGQSAGKAPLAKATPQSASAIDQKRAGVVDDVILMKKNGLSDDVILMKLQADKRPTHPSTDDLIKLKQAGSR